MSDGQTVRALLAVTKADPRSVNRAMSINSVGFHHVVPGRSKHLGKDLPVRGVIVDQQDCARCDERRFHAALRALSPTWWGLRGSLASAHRSLPRVGASGPARRQAPDGRDQIVLEAHLGDECIRAGRQRRRLIRVRIQEG